MRTFKRKTPFKRLLLKLHNVKQIDCKYSFIWYRSRDKARYWSKISILLYSLAFDIHVRGPRWNIVIPVSAEKLEWCGYPMVKKFKSIRTFCNRFARIPACDEQTDRRTDRQASCDGSPRYAGFWHYNHATVWTCRHKIQVLHCKELGQVQGPKLAYRRPKADLGKRRCVRAAYLVFIYRDEHSRLVSIFGHWNRRLYDEITQIIKEVNVKLNKWHITMETLYRKPTETEQNLKKKLFPTVGLNYAPKTQKARAIPIELAAGNSVELLWRAHINCSKL